MSSSPCCTMPQSSLCEQLGMHLCCSLSVPICQRCNDPDPKRLDEQHHKLCTLIIEVFCSGVILQSKRLPSDGGAAAAAAAAVTSDCAHKQCIVLKCSE